MPDLDFLKAARDRMQARSQRINSQMGVVNTANLGQAHQVAQGSALSTKTMTPYQYASANAPKILSSTLGKLNLGGTVSGSSRGARAVRIASKQIGTPYVWGGTSTKGFDCSGLVQYAYGKVGVNLPRVSNQQAVYGKRTKLNHLKPGDLVAWDNSSRNRGADHIAIYAGNGYIIEAARPGTDVRRRKLGHNEGAWGVSLRG